MFSLKSCVFKSFLKVERDAPALVVIGSSFNQRGTTNENCLDCRTCRRQCQTTLTRRAQHPGCNICPYKSRERERGKERERGGGRERRGTCKREREREKERRRT